MSDNTTSTQTISNPALSTRAAGTDDAVSESSVLGQFQPVALSTNSRTPLTVLMTTDTVGGVLAYAGTLAGTLARYNVTIILAAMGGPLSDYWKAYFRTLENVRVFESEYKLEWMDNAWPDVCSAGRWLMRLAERFEPDIVHFNNYAHAVLEWPCRTLVVGHSCVYSWYRSVRGTTPPACRQRYFCTVSRALKRADLVTAPTWSFLANLKDIYGSFRSLGAVYNGTDFPKADCAESKQPIIFAGGRLWDEAKNIDILKKAQPLISAPIYVAGSLCHPDGSTADPGSLRHLGTLSPRQMQAWYTKSAIYVLPALYEPFGLSALEAARAGCALVLGDIPSLREIWVNAALFVNPRDEKSIAGALNLLLSDSRLREQYAHRARVRAMLYPADKMAQRYFDLYQTLLRTEPTYSSRAALS